MELKKMTLKKAAPFFAAKVVQKFQTCKKTAKKRAENPPYSIVMPKYCSNTPFQSVLNRPPVIGLPS